MIGEAAAAAATNACVRTNVNFIVERYWVNLNPWQFVFSTMATGSAFCQKGDAITRCHFVSDSLSEVDVRYQSK